MSARRRRASGVEPVRAHLPALGSTQVRARRSQRRVDRLRARALARGDAAASQPSRRGRARAGGALR